MQKYEWVAGTGNDIVHTKAVDNFGVMLPGFGHNDLLCFPLAGADSNSEPLQAAIVCRAMNESVLCEPVGVNQLKCGGDVEELRVEGEFLVTSLLSREQVTRME